MVIAGVDHLALSFFGAFSRLGEWLTDQDTQLGAMLPAAFWERFYGRKDLHQVGAGCFLGTVLWNKRPPKNMATLGVLVCIRGGFFEKDSGMC